MQSGNLRRRVTVQQRSTVQDTFGAQSTTWSDVATVWAAMNPLQGSALLAAQGLHTETTSQITIRYTPIFADPKQVSAYRINYNNRLFDILGMTNTEERNRTVILFCKEGLSDG